MRSASVKALEALYIESGAIVEATESYPRIYKKAPKQYQRILTLEQEFDLRLRHYFRDLPGRVVPRVDWHAYHILSAADVQVDMTDADWDNETDLLLAATYPPIFTAAKTGAAASHVIYGAGTPPSDAFVQERAAAHAAELVKELNETTKAQINQSIRTSLDLHESYNEAAQRLQTLLSDSSRAIRIARTETVNAYQGGVLDYAIATGATTKTWQCSAGPCPICAQNDNVEVGINDTFPSGDQAPTAHPNCRCGLKLSYAAATMPTGITV